jgi:RNA polymerase sigma-70 factor (ECF subfamily)
MAVEVSDQFVALINANLAIAHKISRVYFDDAADREDVFQEMMFQLWRSFPAFKSKSKFSTWMYRVCMNTALTFRKRQRPATERLEDTHYQISQTEDSGQERMQVVFAAIATLPQLDKAIITLYLDELSYEEIAEITGLSRSNVSVRIFRIKQQLEKIVRTKT